MKVLFRFILVLVALISSSVAWGQVSFTVDAPALTALGQPFRVEFSVDAEPERDSFKAPSFEGFEVLAGPSVSTGHSIQFVNGKQSSSYNCSYTFVLLPSESGTYTIGSASIKVDGKSYTTKPLPIEVIAEEGGAGSTERTTEQRPESRIAKDDILLKLLVSETEVYKGESIRAWLVLYTRVNIDSIESLDMPSFDGFWSQELTFDNTPSREQVNGRVYEAYKIKELLLSPQQSGKIVIPATTMSLLAQVVVEDKRHFDPIFGGRQIYHVQRELKTQPITINVKEFPAGAPASFNGAVGSFRLTSRMPQSEIESNTADQMEITITGSGNLKFIAPPTLSLPESFEKYDTKVVDNVKLAASGASGSITYTYPFVARSAGEFHIDPVLFSYFDPATGQYHTLATEAATITVTDDGTSVAAPVVGGYAGFGGTMRQLDRDIRYIHTDKLPRRAAEMMVLTPLYWLVVVAIVALFVVAYVLLRKRIRDNRNVVARRMKRADKVAVQRLRMAQRSMEGGNRHAFYEEMLRAMWGYISDKFNIPVSNLTKETIREVLYRRGVAADVAEQFCEIISRSEEAQYAPSTEGDMGEVYAFAAEVISKIEDVVKR
ncbi:MAG: protein BatD [Alistipes sp.]|nr:protein BatD [Alistipes sp.]